MPTYSYRCTECGEAFDIVQAFTDATLTVCPACDGKLRKVFSPVGVTFSGSGFYRTDSRTKPSESSSSSSGSGSSSSGDSGQSAPAKKETTKATPKESKSATASPKPGSSTST